MFLDWIALIVIFTLSNKFFCATEDAKSPEVGKPPDSGEPIEKNPPPEANPSQPENNPPEKDKNAKDDKNVKKTEHWYQFEIGSPKYVLDHEEVSVGMIIFIITISLFMVFLLLPYQRLEGAQSCVTSGLGTYYYFMHIIAVLVNLIPHIGFIVSVLGYFIFLVAAVFSCNEKFSTLFLSISASYIITLILCTLVGTSNYIIYTITYFPILVVCIIMKKKFKSIHFLVVKGLVLALSGSLIIDLATPFDILGGVYSDRDLKFVSRCIQILIFFALFIVFYAFAYVKEKIQAVLAKK